MREETGFEVEVEPLDFRYELRVQPEDANEWRRLYGPGVDTIPEETFSAGVAPDIEPVIDPSEHDEYRWCTLDEAETLLKWDENREALRVLRERLGA